MGLPTILFLIFLVLKLTGQIDWSWWWVCAPILIEAILAFIIFFVVGVGAIFTGRKAVKSVKSYDDRHYF